MQKRKLGATDIELSVIGLGSWPMGGVHGGMSWGAQDDQASIDTIHHAMDKGINWIDTAPAYGRGHSEEVIGKALKDGQVELKLRQNGEVKLVPVAQAVEEVKKLL